MISIETDISVCLVDVRNVVNFGGQNTEAPVDTN